MQVQPFYLKMSRDNSWYMDRPHFHESVEFLMPVSRGGEMFVENQVYSLHPGALFILPDATLHKTLASEPYERYVLHVPIPTIHAISTPQTDLYRRVQEAERMVDTGNRYNELLTLLKRLDWEQGRKNAGFGSDLNQMLLLSEFLLQALSMAPVRRWADELCQIERPSAPGSREGALQISAVLEYLQEHLAEKLTLERVASEFFISKYYLSHCFKEATGFSVMEYVINTRILRARRLLQDGYRVQTAGEMVGFQSNEHFIRTFTSLTGLPPKQYAKRFSQGERK
ncbi:AraC family transcriptional regulator [Oscillibacter sp.]|uniref:AraC family transcriptional regulator n=1 Tax=Oscillibacter sp. TaxID=1945593 RepID=UPI0028AFCEDD|nr:AraC family transcriptional regulator [Oscillibacter sp.]